jgi:acetolactate synthase regulatory subunit
MARHRAESGVGLAANASRLRTCLGRVLALVRHRGCNSAVLMASGADDVDLEVALVDDVVEVGDDEDLAEVAA